MARRKAKATRIALDYVALLWMVGLVLLLAAILTTGLWRVAAANDTRALYGELGELQHKHDALLEERSRLMLERSAIGSMQSIESFAATELGMHFPEEVAQVLK